MHIETSNAKVTKHKVPPCLRYNVKLNKYKISPYPKNNVKSTTAAEARSVVKEWGWFEVPSSSPHNHLCFKMYVNMHACTHLPRAYLHTSSKSHNYVLASGGDTCGCGGDTQTIMY